MFKILRLSSLLLVTLILAAVLIISEKSGFSIDEKKRVKVCWRVVPSTNPSGYGLKLKDFQCKGTIRTVENSWGSGAINGRQIYQMVRSKFRSRFSKIWVLNASDGMVPDVGSSTLDVANSKESDYGSYVALDINGEYVLYLHIGKKVKRYLKPKKKK